MIAEDSWQNCYDNGWNSDLLVPEAFSHPAKMARGLVFRIIAHLLEEGLIQPGQTIVDPFGGVATTALPTLLSGLNYLGVELEPRFVELGRKNIEMWTSKFSGMPKWKGQAELLQGDSRKLAELVRGAAVVTSPPYADSVNQSAQANDTEARIERMKAAGIDVTNRANVGGKNGVARQAQVYGNEAGQLGAMKEGPFNAVVTSPPFAGNSGGRGEASRNGIDAALFDRHSGGVVGGMGDSPANLGNLRGVVTSPPFEKSLESKDTKFQAAARPGRTIQCADYGETSGQLGNDQGQTFWQAARQIVEQCALILPSGGDPVADGDGIDFCDC